MFFGKKKNKEEEREDIIKRTEKAKKVLEGVRRNLIFNDGIIEKRTKWIEENLEKISTSTKVTTHYFEDKKDINNRLEHERVNDSKVSLKWLSESLKTLLNIKKGMRTGEVHKVATEIKNTITRWKQKIKEYEERIESTRTKIEKTEKKIKLNSLIQIQKVHENDINLQLETVKHTIKDLDQAVKGNKFKLAWQQQNSVRECRSILQDYITILKSLKEELDRLNDNHEKKNTVSLNAELTNRVEAGIKAYTDKLATHKKYFNEQGADNYAA